MQHLPYDKYGREVDALQQATRQFVALAARTISETSDLTLPQIRLLFAVHDRTSATCGNLARDLEIAPSSVTRLADRLTEAGLIERSHSAHNRTQVLVSLTSQGRDVVAGVLQQRARVFERALEQLDEPTRSGLVEGLTALSQAVLSVEAGAQRRA